MFFTIQNEDNTPVEQLRTNTLLRAYIIIDNYPLHTSEKLLDKYLTQQYKSSLKNLCVKLLLNLTFYINNENNLILIFKDKKYDKLAQLITYGTGAIPGSRILQIALGN
jgi:hypothetical protein